MVNNDDYKAHNPMWRLSHHYMYKRNSGAHVALWYGAFNYGQVCACIVCTTT